MIRFSGLIRAFTVVATVLLLAGPALADGGVPMPHPAKAFKGEKCVEPNDDMRRNHMNYLKHQRDETLREGVRGQKYSLNQCIDCHAVKSPDVAGGKVRTLKPFCKECHSYAAVSIDCFACHTGAANDNKKTGLRVPMTGSNTLLSDLKAHLTTGEAKQ